MRKLAGDVRRWFGLSGPPPAPAGPAPPATEQRPAAGEEAAARIDAARERLRSRITAPEDERSE